MARNTNTSTAVHTALVLVRGLLFDPKYFWILASLVIIGDAVLTELIIKFIPYTEIDWETYMVQTELYIKGQHNFTLITGPTGPLVYPAGHVRIHEYLHNLTDSGRAIRLAQHIYGALYILTLIATCGIYRKAGNIPNWVVILLPLSKRLHSIFVLRLFNDCWAVFLMTLAVLAHQHGLDDTGILLYSGALSVKMSILLYLPGLLVIHFKRKGLATTLRYLLTLAAIQALLASQFLMEDPWSYLKGAFDLRRVFLYKWTVNWRFVDEATFLSPTFALSLLVGHLTTLVAFGSFRWCKPDGGVWKVLDRGVRRPLQAAGLAPPTRDYVATVLFTANLIGILFARSLHYQFYSWYAMQIPFLAWRTKYPLVLKLTLSFAIEYAWNVYPSTNLSSGILLTGNALLLVGIWFGYPNGMLGFQTPAISRSTRNK
ncbi:Dol-P-Man:Man(5)GlcNAc(2)-PP-Dol alpha-1,3-mannosyltransferase [Leucoagaricus sp. SymC.cos]|nr:Dol-P-Man:Man(5)GlcNAc(2)-PP-Dol alpha-1,3-mannosyltransferase [Leucoagaricus sp. SymC.cos]